VDPETPSLEEVYLKGFSLHLDPKTLTSLTWGHMSIRNFGVIRSSKSVTFCNKFCLRRNAPQAKFFQFFSADLGGGECNFAKTLLSQCYNSSPCLYLSMCVTCQILLHLLGAEIPLTSLDRIWLTSHLAYLSEGVSVWTLMSSMSSRMNAKNGSESCKCTV
jgi:hypothetical protein